MGFQGFILDSVTIFPPKKKPLAENSPHQSKRPIVRAHLSESVLNMPLAV